MAATIGAHAWAEPPIAGWHMGPASLRGVTVGPIESSQQPGRGYGTETSAALLDELVRLGANTVSITPFGRIWSLRSTEILMDFESPYDQNRLAVARIVAQAHTRGLRVVLIPHLWVETDGWRGDIDPGTPARWRAYRASYRQFLLAWARDAARAGVDGLAIGVECTSWSGRYFRFWSELIKDVRRVFSGPLTYSANWDEVDDVLFWDLLDWIGVNAFYPLSKADHAEYAEYVQSAQNAIASLEKTSELYDRPVVLMEIGYTTRPNAAVKPWLWPDHMDRVVVDEWEQARALSALMNAIAISEHVRGFFLWRYYANLDDVSQEAPWGFSVHGKLAAHVLRATLQERWASDWPTPPWKPLLLSPAGHAHEPQPAPTISFERPETTELFFGGLLTDP